jgi:hypothetical protein
MHLTCLLAGRITTQLQPESQRARAAFTSLLPLLQFVCPVPLLFASQIWTDEDAMIDCLLFSA